jgi:hypothetical protein
MKNLILFDEKNKFNEFIHRILSFLNRFPKIKGYFINFYRRTMYKQIIEENYLTFKNKGTQLLKIQNLSLFKYKISQADFQNRCIEFLNEGRRMLNYLMEKTKSYNTSYRNIDIHMIYEEYGYFLKDLIYLFCYIQILLEEGKIDNVYIPEDLEFIYSFFRLSNKNNTKIHRFKNLRIERFFNKYFLNFYIKFSQVFKPFLFKIKQSDNGYLTTDSFNKKFIFNSNNSNIGFLYNSITHKLVGNDVFNYLKKCDFNVLEINPIAPKRYVFKKMFKIYRTKGRVLKELKKLYLFYIKNIKNPIYSIYLKELFNIISFQIKRDFIAIDYLYDIIRKNNLQVLVLFNDNFGLGKISAFLCRELNIKTLYFPHGGITETYHMIFPRWCDIMILNAEIEKKFLLNGKLDPKIYSKRLLPLGSSYFKAENLTKVSQIIDVYDKNKKVELGDFNYKILLALGVDEEISDFNIIKHLVNTLKTLPNHNDVLLIIKLHPTTSTALYQTIITNINSIPYVSVYKMDIRNLILSSDLFLTIPSTTILEGILLKTPTIILDYYYDVGRYLYEDPNVIMIFRNENDLKQNLKKFLFDKDFKEEYINTTYNYGLKFCTGYNDDNFLKHYYEEIEKIIKELLNK